MTAVASIPAWDVYDGPLGPLTLKRSSRGLSRLAFSGRDGRRDRRAGIGPSSPRPLRSSRSTSPALGTFDLPLHLAGTPFQQAVGEELGRIPYGSAVTYTELARRLGRPGAVRAVARTPVPIVVPCHRVLGAGGRLTGYLGGLHRKRALLDLERPGDAASPAAAAHAVSEAQEPTVTMGPSPTKGAP